MLACFSATSGCPAKKSSSGSIQVVGDVWVETQQEALGDAGMARERQTLCS